MTNELITNREMTPTEISNFVNNLLDHVHINESKQAAIRFGTIDNGATFQMSDDWIDDAIKRMGESSDFSKKILEKFFLLN